MNKTILTFGSILSAVVLTACGGESVTGTTTTPPVIEAPNEPPVVAMALPDQAGQVGYDFSFDVTQGGTTFTDADGDTLALTAVFSEDIGFALRGNDITGFPNAKGDVDVTITATDPDGESVSESFSLSISIDQDAVRATFIDSVDLDAMFNYANQPVPDYIGPLLDNGNPVTDAGATLGRVLFYDRNLSIDNSVSCSSCHSQSIGFTDNLTVSPGVGGGVTRRHSMRIINSRFGHQPAEGQPTPTTSTQFWDQRAASHEDQATQPIRDPNEHGFAGEGGAPGFDDLIVKMETLPYYEELFRFAFLDPEITEEKMQLALAQFIKSIQSFDSRYDEGRAQVDDNGDPFPNFTPAENNGKALFAGRGTGLNCAACHQPPEFVIQTGPARGHNGVVGEANDPLEFDFTNTRSPSLRDMVTPDGIPNGQFMHDGSLLDLRDVLDHYSNIAEPAGEPQRTDFINSLDRRLRDGDTARQFNLTDAQKDELEAFLRTLSGEAVYTDERWSNPF